ncbi:MAG TPA: trehalose-phosphatase [Steroidobacteraceae bacterium]|nr:trehalose-phosphatase [Steroidobacteraceae bacterium]
MQIRTDPSRDAPAPQTRWCLFLDVDGTLLEIAPTPDAVRVEESLTKLLILVRDALDGAVALISGRSLGQLDELFAPERWPAAGLHGLERRGADERIQYAGPHAPALADARVALADLARRSPGALVEDKGRSLALHYRAVPELEPSLRREIHEIAKRLGDEYHVLEGNRVFEVKPTAATKADAIRAFLAEPPFAGRRPMFIGDDITDLDGFAAVERAGGISVAVGDRVQAQSRVASPRDVRALLADLAEFRVTAQ